MLKRAPSASKQARDLIPHKPELFTTIDPSFALTRSQLEEPLNVDATKMYNGKPTDFTNLQSENLNLDPHRAAMLRRSNFLPYDGVLYEINDAPIEQEALWSFGHKTHLTYTEYQKELRDQKRLQLQNIVVKQNNTADRDYSKSPYRPLQDFFKVLHKAGKGKLKLNIPPTLTLEESERVIYFTDPQSGVIRRIAGDRCDDVLIADLFGFGYPEENGVQLPHSVIKRMSKGRNDMNLLDYNQFVKTLRDSLDGGMLIQKYIKARGNHPSLYRTTWKRHGASTGVLITGLKSTSMAPKSTIGFNSDYFCASSMDLENNTVLSFKGKATQETHDLCARIVDFVENKEIKCQFNLFVGDFLKDENDKWWFLQAKSFDSVKSERS